MALSLSTISVALCLTLASGIASADSDSTLPTVLAIDPDTELVVIEVSGGAPQVLEIDQLDDTGQWVLASVAVDSAQFVAYKHTKDQPSLVRVYPKAAAQAPMVVRDHIDIPPVPRMILTPLQAQDSKPADSAAPAQADSGAERK